ncbi:transcriptional regulator [Nocardia pseudovaccinii]|uniref:transcriptional regulator n=1 Tax=Nocardia pseudovaccinii TaxID=189540 RepID=UPI000A8BAF7E|nr:transcriptional regulator [Nocardia pseudovaccinii]
MVRGREWTGFEAAALQEAMRRSVRDFAVLLGIETTTVINWRTGLGAVKPRSNTQAILDTTLDQRATVDDRARFEQILVEGEASWRERHQALRRKEATKHQLTSYDPPRNPTSPFVGTTVPTTVEDSHPAIPGGDYPTEITDMNRRELLRLLSIATTALVTPVVVDWDRVQFTVASGHVDAGVLDQYASLNRLLWKNYGEAETKAAIFSAAREHLTVLVDGLRSSHSAKLGRRQLELIADALQLTGEILLDGNHLTEAAHCYALSGTFAANARAHDLWACALTRHAYIGIFDNRFDDALPLVEEAAEVARRGDSLLPTRYWIESVRAQVQAGRGEADECQRAFDAARGVLELGETPSLGWLRFSGARIDEEQASCLIQLGQPEPAERILTPLLERPLSTRRRASVLIDLAAAGALRGDPVQTVSYGSASVDIARRTRSGYLWRRLEQLRPRLGELQADRHVAHLEREITRLATSSTH